MDILQFGVDLAQKITNMTGDFDASGILGYISNFLEKFDITSLVDMILGIIKLS